MHNGAQPSASHTRSEKSAAARIRHEAARPTPPLCEQLAARDQINACRSRSQRTNLTPIIAVMTPIDHHCRSSGAAPDLSVATTYDLNLAMGVDGIFLEVSRVIFCRCEFHKTTD